MVRTGNTLVLPALPTEHFSVVLLYWPFTRMPKTGLAFESHRGNRQMKDNRRREWAENLT